MKKTILITGATGFIGARLFKGLKEYEPIGITRKIKSQNEKYFIKCDMTNSIELKKIIMDTNPDIIYHFAAMTNPQRNEKTPKEARSSNVDITKNLVEIIDTQKTHLIFLSTDKVFDGSKNNPNENSKTNPLWIYSSLKLECEKIIEGNMIKYHIIRLPIVHGNGDKDSSSFIDHALIDLRAGKLLNSFNNVKRCYVKVDELTKFLIKLINDSHYGIYHAGSTLMSYFDRISMLCHDSNITVNSILVSVEGEAKPLVQNLNTNKLEHTFNFSFN